MKKILVIGSINNDLVFNVKNSPLPGETIKSKNMEVFLGGKGANQAVALAKLGANVSMFGKVGNDEIGSKFISQLSDFGVDTKYVIKSNDTFTGCANIIVEENGQNRIILFQGANASFGKSELIKLENIIDDFDIILMQLEINENFIFECINLIHSKNKYLILNPGPAIKLDLDIIKKCNLIVPNEIELFKIFGKNYSTDLDEIISFSKKVAKENSLELIVTIGDKGSIYIKNDKLIRQKAIKVTAIDTTAAGDTFIGALISQISNNVSFEEAIKIATVASSICVTRNGATSSIPTIYEVLKKLK